MPPLFFMGPDKPGERGIFGISGALKKAGSRAFLRRQGKEED
mgnify:FL=1